jgi:signal transduction histidine kinase
MTAGPDVGRPRNRAARAWDAVRRLSDRTSLRTKLVASLLVLVILALGVIDFVSINQLQGYLVGRADHQLQSFANQMLPASGFPQEPTGPQIGSFMTAGVYNQSGQLVDGGRGQGLLNIPDDGAWFTANANRYVTVGTQAGGQSRVYVDPFTVNDTTYYLLVASDLSSVYTTVRELTGLDIIVSVVIVAVMAAIGFAVVQANLRALVEIEETAGEIADGHLERRVPERDPRTEIGSLGRSLNTMLSQIESAFHAREESEAAAHQSEERMRRFIADASHELRTPLTAIRGFAEYYRQRGGLVQQWDEDEQPQAVNGLSPEDLDRIMHRVEAEAARMGLLVEDLLLLARMDQQRPLTRNPIDLLSLAADAVHDTRMIAPNRTIDLKVQPGAAFLVIGDEARLRQVIGNLMSNALTHTPDGTPIEVSISSGVLDPRASIQQPAVILDVKDQGPGMAPEQAQRVFERFYRADQARNRKTGGSGLGLAIVAALVAAHGGVASVRTAPGRGATFRVALPLAPEAHGWDDAPPDGFTDEDPAGSSAPGDSARGDSARGDSARGDSARGDSARGDSAPDDEARCDSASGGEGQPLSRAQSQHCQE